MAEDIETQLKVELDTSGIEDLDKFIEQIDKRMKKSLAFYDAETRKIQEIHKIADKQAQDRYTTESKGFRQSHGEMIKLNKSAKETAELFGSLFKEPVKFKDFPQAKIAPDVLEAMEPDLGAEMIEAASGVRETITNLQKASKSTTDFQKEWRKGLTGVLIDLHWFRILASQSKVMSVQFTQMGKALGFLLDMALLPLLPAIIEVVKFVYGIARAITTLPKWFRSLLAIVIGAVVGFTVMETAIFFTIGLYNSLNLQMAEFNANLAIANANMIAKTGMGVGAMGGAIALGAGIGLLIVYLMQITGILKAIYEFGRSFRKWLDQALILPIKFIKSFVTLVVVILKFIWDKIKGLVTPVVEGAQQAMGAVTGAVAPFLDAAGAIIKWIIDSLQNVLDLGVRILTAIVTWIVDSLKNTVDAGLKIIGAIVEWIKSGFANPGEFLAKIKDIILEWFGKELSITLNLVNAIKDAIIDWVKRQLGINEEGKTSLANAATGMLNSPLMKILPGASIASMLWDMLPKAQTGGFVQETGAAIVHKGETIVPSGGVNVTINIQGSVDSRTIDELTKRLKYELTRVRA